MGLRRLPSYQETQKNQIFQFGNDWLDCLANKKACREERLSKYYQVASQGNHTEICLWIINTLCQEHPEFFTKQNITDSQSFDLVASHTNDVIAVRNGMLEVSKSHIQSFESPQDLFDAIAMQVPEDLVVQACDEDYKTNHCARIHLCHANGWSAEWAVKKDFDEIHARVPRISTIIRDSAKMLKAIVESSSPMERVGAVNFRTSPALNRHPEIPDEKRHIPFHHLNNKSLYLRFERQCVVGFASTKQFLFTIRTYRTQLDPTMPEDLWNSFEKCMENASDGTNPHKFLESNRAELMMWLKK